MALYTCTKCGKKVPVQYEVCPFCRAPRPAIKELQKASSKNIEKKKEKKKHPILAAVSIILVVLAIGSVIGGGDKKESDTSKGNSKEDQSIITQDVSSVPDISNVEGTSGVASSEKADLVYNVDWDQCLADLKESVLNQEFFPYAKDVYVIVDEDKKQITFSAVVGDATDPSVALDYADTIVRQYNLMANMQDNNIALGSKDYYGGLYDKYDFLIGVAPQSKTEDSDQWFVFDASIAGAHKTLKLQKAYR